MDKNLTHYFFTMRNKKRENMRTREVISRPKIEHIEINNFELLKELLKIYIIYPEYSKTLKLYPSELTELREYDIIRMSDDEFIINVFYADMKLYDFWVYPWGIYSSFLHDIIKKEIKKIIYLMV